MYNLLHLGGIILLLTQFADTQVDQCPKQYQRYSVRHSYCSPPNKTCEILVSYPKEKDIQEILKLHNSKRNTVAIGIAKGIQLLPPASNMLQMEWDDELAAVAQKYAEQCLFKHDCPDCRRVMNFGVGQNIAMQMDDHFLDPDWKFAVDVWYNEIESFSTTNICPFKEPVTGAGEFRHFSQLSWAETFRIGCGYVVYKQGQQFVRLYYCNYGPQGNVLNECMYKVGLPCSHCPLNTCCGVSCGGDNYPGLCKRITKEPPSYGPPQNTLLYCDFSGSNACDIHLEGNWLNYSTLSGNYLETVLNGGDRSKIAFLKQLPASVDTFCISIKYRKGPNVDGNVSDLKAEGIISTVGFDSSNRWELPDFDLPKQQEPTSTYNLRHQFSVYNMTFSYSPNGGSPLPKKVALSFEVPPGQLPQFFNIKEIVVTSGGCKR